MQWHAPVGPHEADFLCRPNRCPPVDFGRLEFGFGNFFCYRKLSFLRLR
jgi:hypothetical protein